MGQEFCEHMEDYSVVYGKAEATYKQCLHLMDTYLSDLENSDMAGTLATTLQEWVTETQDLRELFEDMIEDGGIEMVPNPQARNRAMPKNFAMCKSCSYHLPCLEFVEFEWDREGTLLYKGAPLPQSQRATEPVGAV